MTASDAGPQAASRHPSHAHSPLNRRFRSPASGSLSLVVCWRSLDQLIGPAPPRCPVRWHRSRGSFLFLRPIAGLPRRTVASALLMVACVVLTPALVCLPAQLVRVPRRWLSETSAVFAWVSLTLFSAPVRPKHSESAALYQRRFCFNRATVYYRCARWPR